ncbi:MAG: DUF2029 domain-containing protein [Deltaproteobacteria bacterium]|nr:DUF2029 domain-containing protein [Deltaproteobacteria bacterium]
MTASARLHRVLCAAALLAVASVYLIAHGAPDTSRRALYIVVHFVLTASMFGVWATNGTATAGEHRVTLATGILARLILIAVPVFTTSDVARYLWDGRAILEGLDPYVVSPIAPEAAALRGLWPFPTANNRVPTIYPPLAETVFALSAVFGAETSLFVYKAAVAAASIATLVWTARLLRLLSLERHLALVALSPLLILEGGVGAHVDIFAAASLAGALLLSTRGRSFLAGGAVGLGVLFKLMPAVLLVPFVLGLRRANALRTLSGAALVVAGGYGLALAAGYEPIGSLFVFLEKWRFGSPLQSAVRTLAGEGAVPYVAAVLGAMGLVASVVAARRERLAVGLTIALATVIIVSPVAHPWYLAPLIVLLPLAPNAFVLGWATAFPLAYEVGDHFAATGRWEPATWPLVAIALTWMLSLAFDVSRARGAAVAKGEAAVTAVRGAGK